MELPQIWKQVKIQKKYAIISTFLFGILAHGPMMFNKFSKYDDIYYGFLGGITFSSGRWMLYVAEKLKNLLFLDSIYNVPTFNTVFSFFCLAAAACILIDLFEIKSAALCTLLSGIMVSIPVVTCMFGYMFTAQFFSLAILMAVAGARLVLTQNRWYWILTGIILMTCSLGIYQAYIPLMVCVFLFGLIKQFSEADSAEKQKRAFIRIGIIAFSCLGFLLLNTVILNFFLNLTGEKLSGYKGIGFATHMPLSTYLSRAFFAVKEFFIPRKGSYYDVFPGRTRELYIFTHVPVLFFFAVLVFQTAKKSKLSAFIIFLMGLFIPIGVNFIFVMVDETFCYAMMVYGYVMYFVFAVWLWEKVSADFRPSVRKITAGVLTCVFSLIVIIFSRFDNVCYMRLEMTQAQTTRFFTSLITRMQDTDGYRADMKVAYIGSPRIRENDTTIPEIQQLNYIHVSPFYGFRQSLSTEPWREFMELWNLFRAWETDPAEFRNLPQVEKMPSYPDKGSIKVINDTLVVKF